MVMKPTGWYAGNDAINKVSLAEEDDDHHVNIEHCGDVVWIDDIEGVIHALLAANEVLGLDKPDLSQFGYENKTELSGQGDVKETPEG